MAILPEDALRRAQSLARRGETQQARQIYQSVLEHDPANRLARDELAALDRRSARFQALSELYRRGAFEDVVREGEALALEHPDIAFLRNIIANAHAGLEKWNEAVDSYARALKLRPDIAETRVNLAKTLSRLGRADEALASLRMALRIKPGYADAHYTLGVILRDLKRYHEAAGAFARAAQIKPDFAEAHDNLGVCLRHLDRYDEAIASLEAAIRLRPEYPTTFAQLGIALAKAGRYPDSNRAFAQAISIKPELADTKAQLLFQQAMICDWESLEKEAAAVAALGVEGPTVRPFAMLPLEDQPERHLIRARRFSEERLAVPGLAPIPRPCARPERLRIGYFSANFHNHAVMYLMAGLLEAHDRSQFRIHAYSFGPAADDEMRKRAKAVMDVFHDVEALSDKEIAEKARADGIDIAVDLMGHTENARSEIFAYRAAPIQVNYLGYPGSMGAPFIDYIVADRILIPDAMQTHFAEKIIYLPHTYMPADDQREISSRPMTRTEMGLPAHGAVFCCFNNLYKIGAGEFAIWMRLLAKVEGSVLWLSGKNEWARANLRRAAKAHGVDPGRVVFAGRLSMEEHLARHRLADLFLDTFHYNAHSTACDALWAGLPMITLAGDGFPARVGASLLTAMGLPELIVTSAEAYERLALELAMSPQMLATIRAKLLAQRQTAPLFRTRLFARNLEAGYLQAYQRYLDGERPANITVSDYG